MSDLTKTLKTGHRRIKKAIGNIGSIKTKKSTLKKIRERLKRVTKIYRSTSKKIFEEDGVMNVKQKTCKILNILVMKGNHYD